MSDDDPRASAIRRDAELLMRSDPDLAGAATVGDLQVRLRTEGFATLIWLILGQQVSIAAARAMFVRLEENLGVLTPQALLSLDDATMRACGFTRQKTGYARGIATAATDGTFSFTDLAHLSDEDALAALTDLHGVGRWTAENYLIWALGRRDVFPAGDLALRVGWARLQGLQDPPPTKELRLVAARWRPRRTAAALLIWHNYLAGRGTRSAEAPIGSPTGRRL